MHEDHKAQEAKTRRARILDDLAITNAELRRRLESGEWEAVEDDDPEPRQQRAESGG